jgi:murein L,D-transpeptidase YcbB/YkuD
MHLNAPPKSELSLINAPAQWLSQNVQDNEFSHPLYLWLRAMKRIGLTILVLLIGLPASSSACAAEQTDTASAILNVLAQGAAPDFDPASLDLAALRLFYATRHDAPCWSGSSLAEGEAWSAISALEHAGEDGLNPQDYHVDNALFRAQAETALQKAERDVILTDGVLRYARDIHTGRADLRTVDSDVDLPAPSFNALAALESALENAGISAFLAGLAPPHLQYDHLKIALAHYRAIAANGDWPQLSLQDKSVDPILLAQRLKFEDTALSSIGAPTSEDLSDAIKRFQVRHGLPADGKIGESTLAVLNVTASGRAMEIAANMERWRWLPEQLETARVEVNVADASLVVVDNGKNVLTSRVIAGRPRGPTPILRAMAVSITINPPWNVPSTIARQEIWPKLRAHRTYLRSHDMILVNGPPGDPQGLGIDWRVMRTFPYRVRQLPGPKNALGQIKLELPNRFDVYLHDTPGKPAFNLDERHLSHGCVRVQQIRPLASYALSGDTSAMIDKLTASIANPTTQHLPLPKPLPIYLLYWTVFADTDGTLEFRRDVYGRDDRLIAAIAGRVAAPRVTSLASECHAG